MRIPYSFSIAERKRALVNAFTRLYEIFGDGPFQVLTTCNVILRGNAGQKYSVYYGQSYGTLAQRQMGVRRVTTVNQLGDVGRVEVAHSLEDFTEVFFAMHSNSSVTVERIVNLVFVITRPLSDFQSTSITPQKRRRIF